MARDVPAAILGHARDERPREACGLLLGRDSFVERAAPAANVAADPLTRFEIDPAALFAARRAERGGGLALLGYYHSHPGGDPCPSATDARMAAPDGRLWIIAAQGTLSAYIAGDTGLHGRFLAITLGEE